MQFNKTLSYLFVALLSLSLLTGCGNGSSKNTSAVENNSTQEHNTSQEEGSESNATQENNSSQEAESNLTKTKGYLIDSPLQGVTYLCDGEEGITHEDGMFECVNAPVTFKVGALTLGTLTAFTADGQVYPQDLLKLARDNYSNSKLKLLARLVQSLDDDGNIKDKITITKSVRDSISKEQNFKDMSANDVSSLVSGIGKTFVQECGAMKHLGDKSLNCESDGSYYVDTYVPPVVTPTPTQQTYSLENGNHALMGPLKNATVKIYKLDSLETSIEETQTNDLGKFNVTLNGVADTEMLLIAISGGIDVDVNDDGVLDSTPTLNSGTIHGFAKASELKSENVNVTLVSEIVYQYTKHLIGEVHPNDLEKVINTISSKLLKDNINRSLRAYQDVNNFVPTKENLVQKLDFNYTALLDGDGSISNLYHSDFNITKIETEFARVFTGKALSFRNLRWQENNGYSKIILEQVINSDITSTGTSLFVDYDENTSKLVEFITKNTPITFTITPQNQVKILGWEGCDSVSDDLLTCRLTALDNVHRITPNIVYKENKYADNVKDITDYQITINDNNYTVSLDLNVNEGNRTFIGNIITNDIIISSNPTNPFFKKVNFVKKIDDNNYIFTTEPISFLKLYKQGSVFTNRNLTHEDLVSQSSSMNRSLLYKPHNGMRLLPPKHKNDDEFVIVFGENGNSFNRSLGDTSTGINVPISESLSLKGSLSFKIKPEFNYNVEWFSLESLRFVIASEIKSKLVMEFSSEISNGLKKEIPLGTLAQFTFAIGPVPILVGIKNSILFEGKAESSISIGGEYTKTTKTGFNYVNGNPVIINETSGDGAFVGEMKPLQLSGRASLKVSPDVLIGGIAGAEVETKLGFYGEITPYPVISISDNDIDTDIFGGKLDAIFTAELKWAWNGYLEDFNWAKNIGSRINSLLAKNGLGVSYSYNLYSWSNQVFERPAYLQLTGPNNSPIRKYSDESVDEHYTFNIKNTGEKLLKWKIEKSGLIGNTLSFSPTEGELSEGEDINIDVFLQEDDLTSKIGKNTAYLKFINLSDIVRDNVKTGTTTKKIVLKVFEKLATPSNLTTVLVGESIKNIQFNWTRSITNSTQGYKIYKTDYNTETGSCLDNYISILPLPNIDKIKLAFSVFENNANELVKMEAGKKYCFKVSAFKLNFDLDAPISESELSEESILEIPAYAILKSNITDKDNNPIENANIYLTSIINNTQTDGTGNYTFENLLPGKYKIVVEAEGYLRQEGEVTLEAGEIKTFERQLVADEDLEGIEGTMGGKVQNALNGSGISGVTIEVRKGVNIIDGELVQTIITDNSGNYSITLETGAYTVSLNANGYIATYETINIYGDESRQKDLSLSPLLSQGNMRIKLSWGENPRDLDSHLVKKVNGSQEYHIYYRAKSGTNGDNLDHDDTTSYGPETVTINNVDTNAIYTYYVHHYSGSSNLKSASAKVEVYYGNNSSTYNVPNEDGIYWKVFEVVNGEVVPCLSNCIESSTNSLIRNLNREESALFNNLPQKD